MERGKLEGRGRGAEGKSGRCAGLGCLGQLAHGLGRPGTQQGHDDEVTALEGWMRLPGRHSEGRGRHWGPWKLCPERQMALKTTAVDSQP